MIKRVRIFIGICLTKILSFTINVYACLILSYSILYEAIKSLNLFSFLFFQNFFHFRFHIFHVKFLKMCQCNFLHRLSKVFSIKKYFEKSNVKMFITTAFTWKRFCLFFSNFGSNESYTYYFPVSLVSRELTQTKEKHASEVSQMKDVIKKTSSSTATQYEKMVGKFENIGISCSDKIDCSASNIFVVIFFQRVLLLTVS